MEQILIFLLHVSIMLDVYCICAHALNYLVNEAMIFVLWGRLFIQHVTRHD